MAKPKKETIELFQLAKAELRTLPVGGKFQYEGKPGVYVVLASSDFLVSVQHTKSGTTKDFVILRDICQYIVPVEERIKETE